MRYLLVGLGNAGNAILNALLEYKEIKSAKPKPVIILLRSESEGVDKIATALERAKGGGVDFALLFTGFSNSNNSNISAAEILNDQKIKTLFIGILPANRREEQEEIVSAYSSLEKLKAHVNSFIIVDNQRIAHHPNYKEFYPRYNRYIASCLVDILAGIRVKEMANVSGAQSARLPIEEVVKALSFNAEPGYVAVSRSSELTKGLMGYIVPFTGHKPLDLRTLLRVSLEKFSVSDAPIVSDKSVCFLRVPDYYVRSGGVDKKLIEEFLLTYSKESHLAVSVTGRNTVAITNLFVYKFEQLGRLRDIRGVAHEAI